VRQTNIVWLAFIVALEAVRLVDEEVGRQRKDGETGGGYDPKLVEVNGLGRLDLLLEGKN
jgi:hypothetical protein